MFFAGKVVMGYSILFFSFASLLVPLALSSPVSAPSYLIAPERKQTRLSLTMLISFPNKAFKSAVRYLQYAENERDTG